MSPKQDRVFSLDISALEILGQRDAESSADFAGLHQLYELHSKLSTETDLTAALQEILSVACAFTRTARGCIQLVSADGKRLEIVVHQGYDDATSPFINYFRYEGFKQGCDAARVERRRLIIEEVVGFPGLEGTAAGAAALGDGIRATQSTPMISHKGETIGVLSNQFTKPHRPSSGEMKLIDLLAWTAADFVEGHQANAAVAADLRDTQLLRDLGGRLVAEKKVEVLYTEILKAAMAFGGADAGTIQLLDENTQDLVLKASTGINRHLREHIFRVDAASRSSCGIALLKNERSFVDFDEPGAADPDGSLQLHREAGFRSAQSIPLVSHSGKPIGMLTTHWCNHHQATERELRYMDLLVRQVADTLELRLKEQALLLSQEQLQVLNTKLMERTLELQQEHYFLEQVTNKTPLFIYVLDLHERRFTYVNERIMELIGRDEDYVYAMGPHLFQAILHPQDAHKRSEYVLGLTTLNKEEIRTSEFRIWNGSSFRWFRSRDRIFLKDGGVVKQVIGIAEDVTYEKMVLEKTKPSSRPVGLN